MVSIGDGVHWGWGPFGMGSIRDGVHSGWGPFGMVSLGDGVHWGWCPFGMVSIRDCLHSGLCLSGWCPFRQLSGYTKFEMPNPASNIAKSLAPTDQTVLINFIFLKVLFVQLEKHRWIRFQKSVPLPKENCLLFQRKSFPIIFLFGTFRKSQKLLLLILCFEI